MVASTQSTFTQGQYTSIVYGYIKSRRYASAVQILYTELQVRLYRGDGALFIKPPSLCRDTNPECTYAHLRQRFPQSRAALSLLGFCFFHLRNYPSAVTAYEALLQLCPGVEEYKMVYAQALYNAGLYPEAMRACVRVEGSQYTQRKLMLQVRDGFHGMGRLGGGEEWESWRTFRMKYLKKNGLPNEVYCYFIEAREHSKSKYNNQSAADLIIGVRLGDHRYGLYS